MMSVNTHITAELRLFQAGGKGLSGALVGPNTREAIVGEAAGAVSLLSLSPSSRISLCTSPTRGEEPSAK